eukprot:scaffold27154_cov31-Phaeocystis_antarctica.AAC.1
MMVGGGRTPPSPRGLVQSWRRNLAVPALLPDGPAAPDDYVMVEPRCDGRSCDQSTTSLRRSARPAPHAQRVTKVDLHGCCAVWRAACVRVD